MRSAVPRNGTRLSAAALMPIEPAVAFGQAAERIVMIHHGLAVGGDLYIDLDAVVGSDRRAHGAPRYSRSGRVPRHAARDGRSAVR